MIAKAMENYFHCQRKDALNKFCPLYRASLVSISPPVDLTSAPSSTSLPPPRLPEDYIRSEEHKGKRTRRGCRSGKLCKELKRRKFDHFPSNEPAPPLSSSSTASDQLHISQPNPNPMPPKRKVSKFYSSQPQAKSKPTKVTTVGEKLFDKFLKGVVTDEKMKLSSDVHTQDLPSTLASSDFNDKKMGSSSMEDVFRPQVTCMLDLVVVDAMICNKEMTTIFYHVNHFKVWNRSPLSAYPAD